MNVAVIGDIHSNKFALESVFQDINTKEIDFILCTGDLVGYLPFPNEVIDIVRSNRVVAIKGNHDQRIGESSMVTDGEINNMTEEEIHKKASMAFTNWEISDENRKYLKNLPEQIKININGLTLLIVHGSPKAIDEYLYEDQETLSELSKTLEEDIIICGHTHIPYHVTINDKHFINVGSVGKPKGGKPQATYQILSIKDDQISSELRKVDYDVESMIQAIEDNKMISNDLIKMLREGN